MDAERIVAGPKGGTEEEKEEPQTNGNNSHVLFEMKGVLDESEGTCVW